MAHRYRIPNQHYRIVAFRTPELRSVLCYRQNKSVSLYRLTVKLHLEPLYQQSLKHGEQLLLGRFRSILGFRLDIKTLVAASDPILRALNPSRRADAPGDGYQMPQAASAITQRPSGGASASSPGVYTESIP
jgi:hypothetical protein